ncbi:hypothetical protein ABZ816_31250 [Actinosynnema sp. NPDC047251]|uniref:Caspase domain-containing protein n=1 Tax=Saccharothrix espanaensis (strain ATCC 51144 / DSM 44229 / JCM 9112 / NBRC 15066 / NRRL 15764) TaxID=1179773 RepID=K0K5I7_SACES|nr:hypothetical protein [Saccharothrix espanaensis]CCH32867.1 hypothetical protein BN6_56080 [Saccharothrix espanaensis DSM 44229]
MRLPDPDKSYAVFLGTTKYSGDLVDRPLPAVRGNVTDLIAALTDHEHGSFLPDHCIDLVDVDDATHILRTIETTARKATDTFLLYVAGHAFPKDPGGNELFLFLPGTDLARTLWWRDALPYAEIRDVLHHSVPANRIVIVDTCFAGMALTEAMAADARQLFDVTGAYTLAAVGPNSRAIALRDAPHTVFTGLLLELLTTGVPGLGELLSFPRVFPYLRARLLDERREEPHQRSSGTAEHLGVVRNRGLNGAWALPEDMARDLVSREPAARAAVLDKFEDLFHTGTAAVKVRVRALVVPMIDDDSRMVAEKAADLLDRFHPDWPRRPGRRSALHKHLTDPWLLTFSPVLAAVATVMLWPVANLASLAISIPAAACGHIVAAAMSARVSTPDGVGH